MCRAGFLAGCLLPLCVLAGWGLVRRTPSHVGQHERDLAQSLGLHVSLAAVDHPRPAVVRYAGIVLSDPETGAIVARCERAELRAPVLADQASQLDLSGVAVEAVALPDLHALLGRMLRLAHNADQWQMAIAARDVTVRDATATHSFTSVRGTIRAAAAGSEAKIELAPADAAGAPAAGADDAAPTLRVVRHRESGASTGGLELHTGPWHVPCAWLFALSGDLPGLAASRFQGSLWANEDQAGWHLAVRGRLAGVELGDLVARPFAHRWQGLADVHIRSAHVDDRRLSEAELEIAGGPGRIGGSLVAAATASLGCGSGYPRAPDDQAITYRQLAATVRIDQQGQLVITGQCPGTPGTILTASDGKPLVIQPRQQPQPVLNVVHALVGTDTPLVPATPLTAQLLRVLPLPQTGTVGDGVGSRRQR